jgi:O-antigen/teichoic acid export membrane protein
MQFKNLLVQSLLWRGAYFISLLLVNVFLSRFLQASGIGWVYYLSNIFSFIQLLASLSIESAISFYAAGSLISYNKLLWFSIAWSFFSTLVAVGSIILYFTCSGNHFEGNQQQYILYATSYIGGILLTNFSTSLFYAQRNFLLPNLIIVLINFIFIFLIPKTSYPFIQISSVTLLNIYFLLFFIQGFILMICFIIKNKSWHQFSIPTLNELKRLFRYSFFAFAANIIFFLVYRIDFWFVLILSFNL